MSPRNAIELRLDRLYDQWNEFALLPDARVLLWLIRPDELRMIETFFAAESHEGGELLDLFVTLAEPFEDVDLYGAALLDGLAAQYREGAPGMEAEGLDASWTPPAASPEVHSLIRLIQGCETLRAAHPRLERLALVLMPSAVSDYSAWQRWILAAAARLPGEVRLVVVDDADAPALEEVAGAGAPLVHAALAGLDMPGALVELARLGGTATPDGQFRVQFAAMATALGQGKLAEARSAADGALKVAGEMDWPHLTAAVHFAMASGLMGAGRVGEAIATYQEADAAGKRLAGTDEALGSRIRLNSAFGVGAALLGASDHAQAAVVYETSAAMAERTGDPLMLMECWRMAAYCHEQTGDRQKAWERGFMALEAAAAMPPQDRANSTLPFARDALLRLAGDSRPHAEAVERRYAELLAGGGPESTGPAQ